MKQVVAHIQVGRIHTRGTRRPLDAARVSELAKSIDEIGLLNPVTITLDDGSRDYWLVAGAHRLAACQLLKWKEIPAVILDCADLLCELAEIDENLVRRQLTKVEESDALRRRKAIYERLHPETTEKEKRATGRRRQAKGLDDNLSSSASSFTADTAAKTGRSTRSIQRAVDLGSELDATAKAILAEDPKAANNATAIKAVEKAGSPEKQREAAKEAVRKARAPKPRRVRGGTSKPKDTPAIPADPPPDPTPVPRCADHPDPKRPHYDIVVDQLGDHRWTARCDSRPSASADGATRTEALTALAAELDRLGAP